MGVDLFDLAVFCDLRYLLLLGSLEKNGKAFFPVLINRDIDYCRIIPVFDIALALLYSFRFIIHRKDVEVVLIDAL